MKSKILQFFDPREYTLRKMNDGRYIFKPPALSYIFMPEQKIYWVPEEERKAFSFKLTLANIMFFASVAVMILQLFMEFDPWIFITGQDLPFLIDLMIFPLSWFLYQWYLNRICGDLPVAEIDLDLGGGMKAVSGEVQFKESSVTNILYGVALLVFTGVIVMIFALGVYFDGGSLTLYVILSLACLPFLGACYFFYTAITKKSKS